MTNEENEKKWEKVKKKLEKVGRMLEESKKELETFCKENGIIMNLWENTTEEEHQKK